MKNRFFKKNRFLKKNLVVALVFVVVACTVLLLYVTDELHNKSNTANYTDEKEYSENTATLVRIKKLVYKSEYASDVQVTIDLNEPYLENYLEKDTESLKIDLNIGDNIEQGMLLYECGDRKVYSDYKGRVVTLEKGEALFLQVLNQEKIDISMRVPLYLYEKINLDSKIWFTLNNEEIQGYIKNIGYHLEEDMFEICLGISECIVPGTKLRARIVLEETKPIIAVPPLFIQGIKDNYFCDVLMSENPDGEIRRCPIVIGREFVESSGGDELPFVEILSGISEGDVVRVYYNSTVDFLNNLR